MFAPLGKEEVDISKLASEITEEQERTNPNVVKAVCAIEVGTWNIGECTVAIVDHRTVGR